MDIVKHLIGLGANVGQRNAYRQTAYDVATSHIVRQYLLPLQLRVSACTDSRVLLACLRASLYPSKRAFALLFTTANQLIDPP